MPLTSSDKNIIRGFLNIFDCHLSIFDETWSKVRNSNPKQEYFFLFKLHLTHRANLSTS